MAHLEQDLVQCLAVLDPIEETYRGACVNFAADLEAIACTQIMGCCSVTLEQAQDNMVRAAKSYNDCCNAVYRVVADQFGNRIAMVCPELWEQWQDGIITARELIFKTIDSFHR